MHTSHSTTLTVLAFTWQSQLELVNGATLVGELFQFRIIG